MQKFRHRNWGARIGSLLLVMVYLITSINFTTLRADAAEDITLSLKETKTGSSYVDIQYYAPSAYTTMSALLNDGYTKLQIVYEISSYTASGTAGIQGYFSHGDTYAYETGGWVNLSDATSGTVTFDFSSYNYSDTLQFFGVQIANVSSPKDVKYTISSVKLIYTGEIPSGEAVDPSSGSSSGSSTGSYDGNNIGTIDTSTNYNFAKLLQLSLYFYDANMCGDQVSETSLYSSELYSGWRGDCHTSDSFTYNGKTYTVTGGYHDAGDHVKFGLPMASSFIMLGAGYETFKDAYDSLGQTGHFQTITDYYCDYIRSCMALDDSGELLAFCYQVGDGEKDHASWVSPETENQSATNRSYTLIADASNPGTDIVAGSAAALAFNYINFKNEEDLTAAKQLFAFAKSNTKQVATQVGGFYSSSRWVDKYCLAAALLYKITGDETYKTEYNSYRSQLSSIIEQCASWDNVAQLAVFYAPEKETAYESTIASWFNSIASANGSQYYCATNWGSARANCNTQMMMLLYDKKNGTNTYGTWARYQMSTILGNNTSGINLVCGYNEKSPTHPHHRAASGYSGWTEFNSNATQKYTLYGALVGGPTTSDFSTYQDIVTDATFNEVACDYNACLVGAAAALYLLNKDSTDAGFTEQTLLEDFYGGSNFAGDSTGSTATAAPSSTATAAPSSTATATPSSTVTAKPSSTATATPSTDTGSGSNSGTGENNSNSGNGDNSSSGTTPTVTPSTDTGSGSNSGTGENNSNSGNSDNSSSGTTPTVTPSTDTGSGSNSGTGDSNSNGNSGSSGTGDSNSNSGNTGTTPTVTPSTDTGSGSNSGTGDSNSNGNSGSSGTGDSGSTVTTPTATPSTGTDTESSASATPGTDSSAVPASSASPDSGASAEPSSSAAPSSSASPEPSESPSASPSAGTGSTSDAYDWGDILPEDRPDYSSIPSGIWIAPIDVNQNYTGKAVTLDLHVYHGKTRLVEGRDYTAVYKNNKKEYDGDLSSAKAPSVTVKGKGNYSGTASTSLKFYILSETSMDTETEDTETGDTETGETGDTNTTGTVAKETAAPITDLNAGHTKVVLPGSVTYEKGGVKPDVQVYVDDRLLRQGKDYTLKYDKATDCGTATVTIKGKGTYKGTYPQSYTIQKKNLSDVVAIAADKQLKTTANYKTTVTLYDSNGKKLSAGKDYDKAGMRYTYEVDTTLADGSIRKAGETVDPADQIASATKIKVTVSAAGSNYTGEVSCSYVISSTVLTKAKIKIDAQSYTGSGITIDRSAVHVTLNGQELVYGEDYEIDPSSYMNNVKKGTASLVIRGLGTYEGCSKRATFKITCASMAQATVKQ